MEEKIPPQNLEAEQSVLGAMMMSKDAIVQVAGRLKPDYFYRDGHAELFKSIVELYKKNEPVDLVTVCEQLKKNEKLDVAGGRAYIADVLDSVPSIANVSRYADIVIERALLRKLIHAGTGMVSSAFDATDEVNTIIDSAQKNILDISREWISDDFVKLKDILMPVMDNIEKVYESEDNVLGIPTGFKDLDMLTSGMQESDLIILAARPAMGKTTFALNIARNADILQDAPVAVFSMEMPKEQLAMRLLASESKIDTGRLRTANILEHEYKDLSRALGKLSEAPIYIDDSAGLTPLELKTKCRRLQVESDVKFVIIDYLQLMRGGSRRIESRFQEVSEIVREIKAIAKELRLPIMALSQLSRDIEKRKGDEQTPKLSDLRESGEIEQTADLVLFIHREDYYDPNKDNTSLTKLIIAKQRNGPTGAVDLIFRKDVTRFYPSEKKVLHPA